MIGVVRGTVYTEFATIKEGLVLAERGKVTYVGEKVRFGSNYRKIDAKGKFVTRGLIDAHSHIGLIPEGLDWEYSDVNDFSGPIKPEMRVINALDFFDKVFQV